MEGRRKDKGDPARESTVPEARKSGMRPKALHPESPHLPADHPHHALAAVLEIHDLLRPGVSPCEAFVDLVAIVERIVPLEAMTLLTKDGRRPSTWLAPGGRIDAGAIEALAVVALRYFDGAGTLEELESAVDAMGERCLTLPIADDEGVVRGLVCVAPRGDIGDEAMTFLTFVARHLATVLVRELRAAAEAARPTPAGEIVQSAATSELASSLVATFEYEVALAHVARIIVGHVACGCVIDIVTESGLQRIAEVPPRVEAALAPALDGVVASVIRNVRPAVARQRAGASSNDDDDASAARAALGMDWLLCVPIACVEGPALGSITLCGSEERHAPIPLCVASELARRAAIAIENRRAYANALEAVRDRDHTLAIVSHDLKNPLGVILLTAAHMLEAIPKVDRRQQGRRQLESIQRAAKRMLKLVGDLLDLAALEEGQLSMRPGRCDLARVVADAVRDFGAQASAANITLRSEVVAPLPHVWADEHRITQVLANLLCNALKFTPTGGHVTVSSSLRRDEVAVTVADDGRGIRAADLPHVFDRFWQARGGVRGGSGLGLTICRSIMERSGGRIWVESDTSAAASGTRVTFTLPVTHDGTPCAS